jgi:hypothetical protein
MNDGIPCIQLDEITIPSIQFPAGAELKGVADFAAGIPSNCKINLSLLVQLGPMLASMGCILKILELLGSIVEFATAAPNLPKMVDKAAALPGLFAQVAKCLPPLAPIDFALMIKGILELIINILTCLIDSVASIVEFQVSLDFSSAEGNPALTEALQCAQRNADTSMQNLFNSVGPIMTVMKVVGSVASLAQLPVTLPDLSQLGKAGDVVQTVESLKQAIHGLKSVIDSLPG